MRIQPARVLDWFAQEGRAELPWRSTRDPWAILVAEVMLQQTQVARVAPRWRGFLDRFPDPAACAAAAPAAVLRAWEGLGYNRRGLALHRCAVAVVDRHDGRMPLDLGALLALPGIGPYTARAVLVFAGERHHGVLDTNIARVLARVGGRPLRPREAQDLADALVPAEAPWAWNSALMDLGATVCTKRRPRDALRRGPVAEADAPAVMGWPDDPARAERVLSGLVRDGLVVTSAGALTLP
ncbi:MAG: A/G-specific adenine glycosylase [Acidimicrobiales bacterium]|nr:A/G-specific adenine glycosylase [Acidimicrobiales bacterium]